MRSAVTQGKWFGCSSRQLFGFRIAAVLDRCHANVSSPTCWLGMLVG
jgi:hypothetical protein